MQDQVVQFDPGSIDRFIPWQTRAFIFYLFVAGGIWLVRSIKLFLNLGIVSHSPAKAPTKTANIDDQAQKVAVSALTGKPPITVGDARGSSTLKLAEPQFAFLWEGCRMKVMSLKRLAGMTFLISILYFAWGAARTLIEIGYSKTIGIGALGGGFGEVFTQFALGVGVCLLLYATSGFFEGRLMKRRATWNYICAKANIDQQVN